MRLPQTVTIGSRDLPPGARGLEGMTFQVRYSIPLTIRLRLGFALMRAAVWLIGGATDIAPEDGEGQPPEQRPYFCEDRRLTRDELPPELPDDDA